MTSCLFSHNQAIGILCVAVLAALCTTLRGQAIGPSKDSEPIPQISDEHTSRVIELKTKATNLFNMGNFRESLQANLELMSLQQTIYPKEMFSQGHVSIARTLLQIAICHSGLNDYQKSKDYCEQSLTMCRAIKGAELELLDGLVEMSVINTHHREFDKAETCLREAELLCSTIYPLEKYPKGNPSIGDVYHRLGQLSHRRGNVNDAISWFEKAVAVCKPFCESHADPFENRDAQAVYLVLARSLFDLGQLRDFRGEFSHSIAAYQDRMWVVERLYNNDSFPRGRAVVAHNLRLIAAVKCRQQKFVQGLEHSLQALAMLEEFAVVDKRSLVDLVACLSEVAVCYERVGQLEKANQYCERAIATAQLLQKNGSLPKGSNVIPSVLRKQGTILIQLDNVELARRQLTDALAGFRELAKESKSPTDQRLVAICSTDLARVLIRQGECHQATEYLSQTVEAFKHLYSEKLLPNGHPELAMSLQNVASIYVDIGEVDKALECVEEAIRIWDRLEASDPSAVDVCARAAAYGLLGDIYRNRRDLKSAKKLCEQSHHLFVGFYSTEQFPLGHADVALSHARLASLYLVSNEPSIAMTHIDEALRIARRIYPSALFPDGHELIVTLLQIRARALTQIESFAESALTARDAAQMQQRLAYVILPGLSEAEGLNYVNSRLFVQGHLLRNWHHTQRSVDELFEVVWSQRAIVLRTIETRQITARRSESPEIQSLLRDQQAVSLEIGKLLRLGTSSAQNAGKELTDRKEELERKLAQKIPRLDVWTRRFTVSPEELKRTLSANAAYVEFVSYFTSGAHPSKMARRYAAFVMTADKPITLVDIGDAEAIDSEITRLRVAITSNNENVLKAGQDVREKMWIPIEAAFNAKTDVVYLCPDSAISAIPWCALPGRQNNSVLLQDYSFAIVPGGHYLLQWLKAKGKVESHDSLLLVGDVNYASCDDSDSKKVASRGVLRDENSTSFPTLTGTRDEIDFIVGIANPESVAVLRGSNASTFNVINELPKCTCVHFATHGYFTNARIQSALKPNPEDGLSASRHRYNFQARNPLLLSGLVLAGANSVSRNGSNDTGDGILAAEIISRLPLDNLELAVLSACETGLGDVAGGEGCIGLQRAFHTAGAKNTIATLWKVDDHATSVLMQSFYSKLLKERKSPLQSLHEAQLYVYQHPELLEKDGEARGRLDFSKTSKLKPDSSSPNKTHPRFWAAFVLSGPG